MGLLFILPKAIFVLQIKLLPNNLFLDCVRIMYLEILSTEGTSDICRNLFGEWFNYNKFILDFACEIDK